jgi:hypothetical protein
MPRSLTLRMAVAVSAKWLGRSGGRERSWSTERRFFGTGSNIPRSFWAKAFYDSHRARGARHQAALRALAFKWIRILHRCWLDRVPYDEARYLMALQKRSAPLLKHAAQTSG